MTHELILTSVSQGLEPDSEGFCVVAASRAIPPVLVKRLGPLSDYRHLFFPGSENAQENPVVYSHLIVPTPETVWHVLSRVADAGVDHRHEPNRLAHHVALREEEFIVEGPAWLLALPEFHFTEWITPAVRFETGRPLPTLVAPPPLTRRQRIARQRAWLDARKMSTTIPSVEDTSKLREQFRENEEQYTLAGPPTSPCPLWREATGDAGWGAVLAETIRTGQQAVVLFRPGTNLLPLFVEALSLLPSQLLWKATFSTCFTKLPEHVPCQWKGVPVDTPEAQAFLDHPDLLLIDLTRPLGPPPPGPYVEYARYGQENLIPENEVEETPFLSSDFDTKTYHLTDPESTKSEEIFGEQPAPDRSLTPPITSSEISGEKTVEEKVIPPIITDESIRIRPMPTKKSQGVFVSFLNMKSRGQFYILYGATLLVVLLLLLLVLDQVADLGLTRWLRSSPAPATTGKNPDKARSPKTTASTPSTSSSSKLDETAIRKEQDRIKKEQQEQVLTAKRRQRERLAQVERTRQEIRDKAIKAREELDDFLLDFSAPKFLPLVFPENGNLDATLPMQPFAELAPLYPFGSALEVNLLPLQDHPKLHVETRKLEFFREEAPDADAAETTESTLDKIGPADSRSLEEKEVDLRIPDTTRFEWRVFAVDTDSKHETPMFHLRLTADGLYMTWEKEGLSPQHRNDTLRSALGFLRFHVVGERNMTKIKSVALFQAKTVKPVFFAERFGDPENREFAVETPLAREPWKTLFGETTTVFSFRLETTVQPEFPAGVREIVLRDDLPASRFFADFETEISSRKAVGTGRDEFLPVAIPFEGIAEADRIVWADRYDDRIRLLNEELEERQKELASLQDELGEIRRQGFNTGGASSVRPADQQKRQRELQTTIRNSTSRIDEIKDILEKLPSAHEKIIGNKQLRFDFSLFLVPGSVNGENTDERAEPTVTRMRNEEALLILTTSGGTEQPAPEGAPPTGPSEKSTLEEESEQPIEL